MPIVSTDAIIIKYVDFSESSLILTLFTRNYGKIRGIAKGARRLKNPFEFALDILAQISVSFISKNSEALDLLTEAKLKQRFYPKQENLGGMYAGCYVAELLDSMTECYQPIPQLYKSAELALTLFQEGRDIGRHLLEFEWSFLNCLGYEPSLTHCVECGRDIVVERYEEAGLRIPFAFVEGGVVCNDCRSQHEYRAVTSLSGDAVRLLKSLERKRTGNLNSEDPIFPKKVRWEVRGLMNSYMSHLLGKRPGMYDYLSQMIREPQ